MVARLLWEQERPIQASMPDRCPGAIPGGSTENKKHSPVVQRQRRLVHIQETMVRFHPGLLTMPRYANRQSGSAQTRGFAGSIPALGT
jgi:hypothetical protein